MVLLPVLIQRVAGLMRAVNVVQVRCPGNLGLIGVALAPLIRRRYLAKYAGQWTPFPGEAATVRLQRRLLRSRWWRGPVLVYGEWPNQPEHVTPIFNSVLTDEQGARGRRIASQARTGSLRVLFVGRLSRAKNAGAAIHAIADVAEATLEVVGDGPERGRLEALAESLGVSERVRFLGALPFEAVLERYEQTAVLVLASETEGWPKVVVEAMAFGVLPIASNRGLLPRMLERERGFLVEPGDAAAIADRLRWIAANLSEADAMRSRAAQWAGEFTQEKLQERFRQIVGHVTRPRVVMQLVDSLDAGGLERMAVQLANALSAECDSVLCASRRGGHLKREVDARVALIVLRRRTRFDIMAIWRLARSVRQSKVDVMHAHGSSLALAAVIRLLCPRVRLVWHDHYGLQGVQPRPASLYRLLVRMAHGIIAVSEANRKWAEDELGYRGDRIWQIPNFVVQRAAREVALKGRDGRRIIHVANFRTQKDHATLLEAFARVLQRVPDAHLTMVGAAVEPGIRERVEELAVRLGVRDAVTFWGPSDDAVSLIRAADVAVLSSVQEALPLVLLEYGQQGKAVVTTDVGDCPSFVHHKVSGLLVAPRDAGALGDALCTLLSDKGLREAYGRELQGRVKVLADAGSVKDRVMDVYADVSW